jgi:homotetrameric cytidine deaminase
MTHAELYALAEKARVRSYSPYSHFAVGAALICSDGTVYTGCNIENAAYSPTVCAERVAIFKAVSEGRRDFSAIAVAGGPADADACDDCFPCGVCRQVLSEFCPPTLEVVTRNKVTTLDKLLPHAFGLQTCD